MNTMSTAWRYVPLMAKYAPYGYSQWLLHCGSTGGGGRAWEHHCETGISISMPAEQQSSSFWGAEVLVDLYGISGHSRHKALGQRMWKAYLGTELCWSFPAWQWKTWGRFSDILPALIHLWHGRGSWQRETSGLSPAISAEREQRINQKHYRERRFIFVSRSYGWLSSSRIPGCFACQQQLCCLGWLPPAATAQSSAHRL